MCELLCYFLTTMHDCLQCVIPLWSLFLLEGIPLYLEFMNDSKISYRGATYLLKGMEFPRIILANLNGIFEAMVLKSKIIMSSKLSGRIVFLI